MKEGPPGTAAAVPAEPPPFGCSRSSVAVLAAANVVPLTGLLFGGWDLFTLVFLYWTENVVIGFVNLARLGMARVGCLKLFLMPFFALHYGGFTAAHGAFVVFVFGPMARGYLHQVGENTWSMSWEESRQFFSDLFGDWFLWVSVVALAASHGYSFVSNYVRGREYLRVDAGTLMVRPYGRVVVLHVAILLGAYLFLALSVPTGLGALVVMVLKAGLDAWQHIREHRTLGSRPMLSPSSSGPAPSGAGS